MIAGMLILFISIMLLIIEVKLVWKRYQRHQSIIYLVIHQLTFSFIPLLLLVSVISILIIYHST